MSNTIQPAEAIFWFVLRVTYQRELPSQERLDKLGIESFVPTRLVRRTGRLGRFVWVREAIVHNYIFIHTTKQTLETIKREQLPWLRYVMCHTEGGWDEPQVVPEVQMASFIAVAGNTQERVLFLNPEEIDLTQGDRVRITGGPFVGVVGVFMRVTKQHERRVIVKIDGVTAVATTSLPSVLVEKI
ncbi:MAG: UpxY family transcription antiterminator [Alistipes sp.]